MHEPIINNIFTDLTSCAARPWVLETGDQD
jgi:hypothetical protein